MCRIANPLVRIAAGILLLISALRMPDAGSTSAFAQTVAPNSPSVRIGVLGLFHSRVFTITALPGQAVSVNGGSEEMVLETSSGTSTISVCISKTRLVASAGDRVFRASTIQFSGRNGQPVRFQLAIPGRIARRYDGTIEINATNGELAAIVSMDLETAVASVVAAESTSEAHLEALKAQAIATRSYLIAGRGRHADFDFCDTTHCQFLREVPNRDSSAARAAIATRGMVLAYNSRPFSAMYTRTCSGQTKTAAQVGLRSDGYPYFAVECKYCLSHAAHWTTRISSKDAASLRSSNEASRLETVRRLGWNTVPSNDFVTKKTGDEVVLRGIGHGHGIGLCQAGAKSMAEKGAGFSEILSHYYPNASIVRWTGKD